MTRVRDSTKALALRQEVQALLAKGAIEPLEQSSRSSGFYSTYFIIPKKGGGLRPILDLRHLNRHLRVLKFHMLRTADVLAGIRRGDWFTSVDLTDAYFHVPIAPRHRPFLRFAFEGKAYQFKVLPFGISLAPRVFTRFVAAALAPLQGEGMRIFPYLDDWLICSSSRDGALRDSSRLLRHIAELGISVNLRKSLLTPTQRTVFLGILLDSCLMTARPSDPRIDTIMLRVSQFQRGVSQTLRSFQVLIGLLTAASRIVPLGLLYLRPLQRWVNSLGLHPRFHRYRPVVVTSDCMACLRPWRRRSRLTHGVPMGVIVHRREVVTTDASLTGWGAVWQCRAARGSWNARQRLSHINDLELLAVLMALRHFLPYLEGRHVLVRTDNTSVVYLINHQGGTRSQSALVLTRRLLLWAHPRLLSLRASHIPGVQNSVADLLSRGQPHPGEWRLHADVVQDIWRRYGTAQVDLFASVDTTHCPLWFSLAEPVGPLGRDALAHRWPRVLLYAFPPLPLILPALERVRRDGHRVLFVAPRWPSRPWFPVLYDMLAGEPWCLPRRLDLLSQLGDRLWHPDPTRLQLWVWPLRGLNRS